MQVRLVPTCSSPKQISMGSTLQEIEQVFNASLTFPEQQSKRGSSLAKVLLVPSTTPHAELGSKGARAESALGAIAGCSR